MSKIVVIGANHHNTLGVVRSLGEAGFDFDLIVYTDETKKEFVSSSKYVKDYYIVPCCDKQIIDLLNTKCKDDEGAVIILPCSDAVCQLLNDDISMLKGFVFPHCTSSEFSLSQCLNKDYMNNLAEQIGFLVPKSAMVLPDSKFDWQYSFPCIVKPLESAKGNKKDITICHNAGELSNCLEYYGKMRVTALVQEYIEPEAEISTMGISFDPKDGCRLPDIIVKKRFSNKSATYAKVLPIESQKDFVEVAEKIILMIKKIGYSGIFDLDFLYSNGKYYFIELNLRNGAYGYAFTQGGINFPADWCRYQIEHKLPKQYIQKNIAIMNEFSDFKTIRCKKSFMLTWLKQFFSSKHLIIQIRDWKPVISYIRGKI